MKQQTCTVMTCLLVLLSGCSGFVADSSVGGPREADITPIPDQQTDGFSHEGRVELANFGEGCLENLTVSMYAANLSLIDSIDVGTICYSDKAPQSKNITLSSEVQPAYIILESPDFWDDDPDPDPGGLVREPDADIYRTYPLNSADQIKPTGDIADPVPTSQQAVNTTTSQSVLATDWDVQPLLFPFEDGHVAEVDDVFEIGETRVHERIGGPAPRTRHYHRSS